MQQGPLPAPLNPRLPREVPREARNAQDRRKKQEARVHERRVNAEKVESELVGGPCPPARQLRGEAEAEKAQKDAGPQRPAVQWLPLLHVSDIQCLLESQIEGICDELVAVRVDEEREKAAPKHQQQ